MQARHALIASALSLAYLAVGCASTPAGAQDTSMSFFLTSEGPGQGAALGGLAGADAYCAKLAAEAGSARRSWRAYLSANATPTTPAVSARDRIGTGPWYNARSVEVANSVAQLHGENNLTKATVLTQKGDTVNGRGDTPNRHDILTGSNTDGTVVVGPDDTTCSNWTSSAATGGAMVGHFDRIGGGANPTSWNSAHKSNGCGLTNLQSTGGNGLFYCFAV